MGFSHQRVQQLRRLLARRSARVEESAFVVEGAVLIHEAVRGGWDVLAQFVSGDAAAVTGCDAPVFVLGDGVLDRVASTESPQPNLAVVSRRTASLARLELGAAGVSSAGGASAGTRAPWAMYLDAVSDPGNLGTILRSAEAMGAAGVVLGSGTVDPFNPKVVRASAGALFHVPVVEGSSLADVKSLGYRVLATSSHEQAGSKSLAEVDLGGAVCVVLGSEAHGVSPELASSVDGWIRIDHAGRAESLNVAMAATIISYELAR
ncbi:MAG: TrmH family RNA methyltransferase, partial [Ilumatobacteraceae bacterium]